MMLLLKCETVGACSPDRAEPKIGNASLKVNATTAKHVSIAAKLACLIANRKTRHVHVRTARPVAMSFWSGALL